MAVLRRGLRGAAMLVAVGALLGGGGTLIGAIVRSDVAGLASWSAVLFRSMAVLLPLVVLLLLVPDDGADGEELPTPPAAALVAGVVGAVAAQLLFVVLSAIVGPVARRLDAVAYSETLRSTIGALGIALVSIPTLLVGALVALLLLRRRTR